VSRINPGCRESVVRLGRGGRSRRHKPSSRLPLGRAVGGRLPRTAISRAQGDVPALPFGIMEKARTRIFRWATTCSTCANVALNAAQAGIRPSYFPSTTSVRSSKQSHEPRHGLAYQQGACSCNLLLRGETTDGDGAEWLQEDHHRERARRQTTACCRSLRSPSWRSAARLCGVTLQSIAPAERPGEAAA